MPNLINIWHFFIKIRIFIYKKFKKFLSYKPNIPVIIIGNISAGGNGKTPLLIAIAKLLIQNNYQPGVISRGYGRLSKKLIILDNHNISTDLTGDEPQLIFKQTNCPVAIYGRKTTAVKKLIQAYPDINIILSDDGLQHYALGRDIEICAIDPENINNRFLREPISRLSSVNFIWHKKLALNSRVYNLNKTKFKLITDFASKPLHIVSGIANPNSFYKILSEYKINNFYKHEFNDHYNFKPEDLNFNDDLDILITEKDAVKLSSYLNQLSVNKIWIVTVEAIIQKEFFKCLLNSIPPPEKLSAKLLN